MNARVHQTYNAICGLIPNCVDKYFADFYAVEKSCGVNVMLEILLMKREEWVAVFESRRSAPVERDDLFSS